MDNQINKMKSIRKEMIIMKEVYEFLKNCAPFYLATEENGQPHVRPLSEVCEFEGKLYIVTNNQKKVYQQMLKNGKVEICGMNKGKWIRVEGTVKEDLRREARVAMMEENTAMLSSVYSVDDNLMTVLYFENGTATIYSFSENSKVITL